MKRTLLSVVCGIALAGGQARAHTPATIDSPRGPVPLMIPDGYSAQTPVPLILSLHGFGGTGESYIQYWEKNKQVDAKRFIVAAPTGTKDSKGRTFWNATDACCNKDLSVVDDSKYLRELIESIQVEYAIDPRSIHVTGYSNGGFMAHRMACEHADLLASVASVAGAGFADASMCTPKRTIHVLQIHGTEDPVIRYQGGRLKNYKSDVRVEHPSALDSVRFWAQHNGAPLEGKTLEPMDLSHRTPGPDTEARQFKTLKAPFMTAELWPIKGETHVPKMTDTFHDRATQWMLSHTQSDMP